MQVSAFKAFGDGHVVRASDEELAIRSAVVNNECEFVCTMTSREQGEVVRGTMVVSRFAATASVRYVIITGDFVPSLELVAACVRANTEDVFYKRSIIRRVIDWIND